MNHWLGRTRRAVATAAGLVLQMLPDGAVTRVADEALRLRHTAQEELRRRRARSGIRPLPAILSFRGECLGRSVLEEDAPWKEVDLAPCDLPGMLTPTERQYYTYVTQFFEGCGEVVELGCWLGLSTMYLVRGLLDNPRFADRKLYVFDDFVWRSAWMSACLEGAAHEAPADHRSFEPIFTQNIGPVRDRVEAARRKICDYDGNEGLPPLTWNRGPVEMLVVDCGRMLRVNEAWWEIFQPHFIPDRTLVIMQDWQHYKNVPEQHWENTKIFTDSKGSALDLVHEARHSGVATFLYRGQGLPHGST